jgi:SAM-dependent methyltransferase
MLLSSPMYDDAARLRDFYATPLGQLARRIVGRRIRERWPDVSAMDVVGLGYASPYLRTFREARTAAALMPHSQGVVQWPHEGPYRSALVPELDLPLRDNSVERVLVVHGLEHVEARQDYLREIWRVLMPQGRVIIAVPNRRGAWAALETTPFGHGRPYSVSQIEKQLRAASLEPVGGAFLGAPRQPALACLCGRGRRRGN